jgi:hypothetical protein
MEGDLGHVLYYHHYYDYSLLKPSISIELRMCIVALLKLTLNIKNIKTGIMSAGEKNSVSNGKDLSHFSPSSA